MLGSPNASRLNTSKVMPLSSPIMKPRDSPSVTGGGGGGVGG